MARPRFIVLPVLALIACDSPPAHPVSKPPPLPPFPAMATKPLEEPAPAQEATAKSQEPQGTREPPAHAAKQARSDQPSKEKPNAAKAAPPAKTKPLEPSPAKPAASSPAPAPQPAPIVATSPKPEAAGKVSVPKTVHLAIDVPSGLQADLNRDPRMQPWINQVVATIDRCYASESKSNANLAGTIEVLVTMHENERPDADIRQLPPALSPIVACSTGGLMRTKMPLFTGKEGTRYPVKIRFSP